MARVSDLTTLLSSWSLDAYVLSCSSVSLPRAATSVTLSLAAVIPFFSAVSFALMLARDASARPVSGFAVEPSAGVYGVRERVGMGRGEES
jgi:hypothetical protein